MTGELERYTYHNRWAPLMVEPIATGSCVMSQKMCAASGIGRYEGAVRSKLLSHCGSTSANLLPTTLID